MDLITIVSFIIGILGLLISFYFGLETKRIRKRNVRFDWEDIQLGTRKIGLQIFDKFTPDFIFCSSCPSSIIANLMLTEIEMYIPIYVGFAQKIGSKLSSLNNNIEITTSKWKTSLPNDLLLFSDKKVLVVEDCVITGDTVTAILNTLLKIGYKRENILITCLITTEFAINSKKNADMHYFVVSDNSVFYMPWGKGIGKSY